MAATQATSAHKPPQVGITTTVPLELLLAAGVAPVDLNNRFITHPDPAGLVRRAEEMGLPATLCAWIKGIYAWLLDHPEVQTVIGVTQGDCSNTHALMELLSLAGRRVIPFAYPHGRDRAGLVRALAGLAAALDTSLDRAEQVRRDLTPLRRDLERLDRLTWQKGRVSGAENHLWLVSASDLDGDPADFQARLRAFLRTAEARPARQGRPRLGVLGVPTIIDGLNQTLEDMGAAVVYNEVPHQFALLPPLDYGGDGLAAQYLRYTYPYDVFHRAEAIAREAARRGLDGLIHYTQTFCYRQVQDLSLRQLLALPMLTIEGNQPGPVDGRTRLRLEAFLERLS
ncbi:MAG: 2-hydroxyacyl-CoA dehydratase [Pseudomonadota bacterium]